jgi:hypothetical protein
MGVTAGVSDVRSKLAGESGSKASMLIVRQLTLAMMVRSTILVQIGMQTGRAVSEKLGGLVLSRGAGAVRSGEVEKAIVGCVSTERAVPSLWTHRKLF